MTRPREMKLLQLEGWARTHYLPEEWASASFLTTLEEQAMVVWGIDRHQARKWAEVVQLRLTHSLPPAASEAIAP